MMYGITFRGKRSRDMGIIVKSKNRPSAPIPITTEEAVAFRDGSVDYSNQGGRLYYEDKVLELEFILPRYELRDTHIAISQLVGWLSGWYGELIFDDMPLVAWQARPVDLSDVTTELFRIGRVSIQFRCRPFNHLLFTNSGVILDFDIPLDSIVPIDYGINSTAELETGEQTIQHIYVGDAPVKPKIIINGENLSSLCISVNGAKLSYDGQFSVIEIDCEKWRAYADGVDITAEISGDYGELLPGENQINVTVDKPAELKFDYKPLFMYGAYGLEG